MPTKQRKPTNAGSRFQTHLTFDEVTRSEPHKPLTEG
ncbi:MAG: 50S ribosomal protein L2, partial [Acidobacteriota bacterium]